MKSFNQWTGIGNLGTNPEAYTTSSGKQMVKINIAVNQRKEAGQEDITLWFPVIIFGKTAEFVKDYVKKGDAVHVTGELSYASRKTKQGDPYKDYVIVASNIIQLPRNKPSAKEDSIEPIDYPTIELDQDDIPF